MTLAFVFGLHHCLSEIWIKVLYKAYFFQEMMENNRQDVTISMMKRYPQLLRKFMADKGKIAPLVDIITHMNLELYSLKRQEQVGCRVLPNYVFGHVLLLSMSDC